MAIPQGGVHNITLYQGADFTLEFQLMEPDEVTPIPLTGYTAKAEIRAKPNSPDVLAEFATAVTPALGKVLISLTEVQTAALSKEKLFYDIFLTGADSVMFIEGAVTLNKRVTVV